MYAAERQRIIAAAIESDGHVTVVELTERLGVTSETVRRDLDALEAEGVLRRVHGGAVAAEFGATTERPVAERESRHAVEKRAAADAALRFVPRGGRNCILIDAGTTTAALAERIAELPRAELGDLTVVCNAAPIVQRLAVNPAITIVTLGGRFRGITAATVGHEAVEQLSRLRPDVAFIGANGLSAGFGASTPDADEGAVKRAMVRAGRRTIAVVDASKFGVDTLVRVAALDELDAVATDAAPAGELAAALDAAGVEIAVGVGAVAISGRNEGSDG